MVDNETLRKLFRAFPAGIINRNLEFVACTHQRVNSCFQLEACETEEDVAAKLLEWLSRDAYKSEYFRAESRNKEVHAYHLQGINSFCGTNFSPDDIGIIYCRLGNGVNHDLALMFIRSGYDMNVLARRADHGRLPLRGV